MGGIFFYSEVRSRFPKIMKLVSSFYRFSHNILEFFFCQKFRSYNFTGLFQGNHGSIFFLYVSCTRKILDRFVRDMKYSGYKYLGRVRQNTLWSELLTNENDLERLDVASFFQNIFAIFWEKLHHFERFQYIGKNLFISLDDF